MSKYLSRMWIIALLFTLTGCAAFLFMDGKLSGGDFVTLALGVLGAFGAKDAAINWIHRDKPDPDQP